MRGLKPRRVLAASAGLALVLGVAACGGGGGDSGEGPQRLDLVIGDSIPLTGALSDFGPPARKASNLAIARINEAIGATGVDHAVEVVHEDNRTNPRAAVQAARKLVDGDGASCLTGAWASADTIETAKSVSIPDGVLQISPASTSDEITSLEDEGLVDRITPPNSVQGPSLANAIAADLGGAPGRTASIGARDDEYGTGLAESFKDAWEEAGGTVEEAVVYEPDQPTYTSAARQITAGDPDAFVILDYPETFARLGPALQSTGDWDPGKAWGTDGLASRLLPGEVGRDVVGGMRGIVPGAPDGDEAAKAFDALYTGAEPAAVGRQTFDAQQFDATILCYLAAVRAGSTDGQEMADALIDLTAPGGEQLTWRQLPDLIRALQNGEDVDYVGASGQIDMDENGDATAGVYDVYEFRGGGMETIGETPITTGE